jgi:hypothetical protein
MELGHSLVSFLSSSYLLYLYHPPFSGTEFLDTVTIAPGLVITRQSIGIASNSSGFEGFDGILGWVQSSLL